MYKRQTLYDAPEAISLVKKAAVAKFDETIEVHSRTAVSYTHLAFPLYLLRKGQNLKEIGEDHVFL